MKWFVLCLALWVFPALAVMAAEPAPTQQDLWLVPDVPTTLGAGTFQPWQVIRRSAAGVYTTDAALQPGTAIHALHRLHAGDWLFTVRVPTDLGGTIFEARDIVRFDGAAYAMFLDGSSVGLPPEARIDSLLIDGGDGGDPVLGFAAPTTLGPDVVGSADLVRVSGGGFSLFFDSATTDPPIPQTSNVTGATIHGDALLLTFDAPTTLGVVTFLPGQVASWDGANFAVFSTDPNWPLGSRLHGLWIEGLPSVCDDPTATDTDGDGIADLCDNCPQSSNPQQENTDGDGAGDACDVDDDGDGVLDTQDCAPLLKSLSQVPLPVGDTLFLDGGANTVMMWQPGFQGPASNVYRGNIDPRTAWSYKVSCLAAERVVPTIVTAGNPSPGAAYFYLVSAVNLCGESPMGQDSAGGNHYPRAPCAPLGLDFDTDSVPNLRDNCPLDFNPDQADADHDFIGDACDD